MMENEWKYDVKKIKEIHREVGMTADAIVVRVLDGKIKEFIPEEKIRGDKDAYCIDVLAEGKDAEGIPFHVSEVFGVQGVTEEGWAAVSKKSKLAAFHAVNGSYPQPGCSAKCIVSKDGFWRFVL